MKSFLSKISGIGKAFRYGPRIQPVRDWLVLLSIAGILFLAALGLNFWYFTIITTGGALGVDANAPAQAAPSVSGVQQLFDARAAERGRYEDDYRFVDPSL